MKKSLLGIITTLLVTGCTTTALQQQVEQPLSPPVYQPGEFNHESLYDLLVAEIAGQHSQFELALEKYLKQARLTRDARVAERATRVAQYLRNPEALQEAASLWIKAAPEDPEPYQIAASILLHQKRYEDALPLMKQALAHDHARMLAVIRSQISTMSEPVVNGYLDMIAELLRKEPVRTDLLITQGLLLSQAEKRKAALEAFDRALLLEPRNPDAIAQKAELLRQMGRLNEALATVKPGLDVRVGGQQLQILYTQLLFQSGQLDAGERQVSKLLQENDKDTQLKFYFALLMLENGRLDGARPLFRELLEQNPSDTRPHFYLGIIAQEAGEIEAAIEHYTSVEDATTLYQAITRAAALLDTPEDRPALSQMIQDVRNVRPDLASELFALEAEWLNVHGFNDDSLAVLEEGLSRLPDDINLLYTRAMLVESQDMAQAEKDLRRILSIDPNSALALNALGYTLTLNTERYEEALVLISRALKIKPDDPAITDSMGWVLFKLERYDEAVTYLQRAYEAINDAEVTGHLIQALWAQGQHERARSLLEQHLSADPDNNHLQDAAQMLEAK